MGKLNVFSYIGAACFIVGVIMLRFTIHKDVYLFPSSLIAIGVGLLVIAFMQRKKSNKEE
jgi:hypothetical protein